MRLHSLLFLSLCSIALALLLPAAAPSQDQDPPDKSAKAAAVERDRIALQGAWELVAVEEMGKERPASEYKDGRYVFLKDKILEMTGDKLNFEIEYEIDPTSDPKRINEYFKAKNKEGKDEEVMIRGIYELDGDTLILCTGSKERPTGFDSKSGVLLELRREKKSTKSEPAKTE